MYLNLGHGSYLGISLWLTKHLSGSQSGDWSSGDHNISPLCQQRLEHQLIKKCPKELTALKELALTTSDK